MEEDDIAAAMGFSSFGAPKKRKFDHSTTPPRPAASASGANSMRLGARPKMSGEGKAEGEGENCDTTTILESTETDPKGKLKQPTTSGLAAFLIRGQALPERPPPPQERDRKSVV